MPRSHVRRPVREQAHAVVLCLTVAALPACGGATQTAEQPTARPAPASRGVATRTQERAHDPGAIGDREIAEAVRRRVARDEAIPPNAIQVDTEGGVVTLAGTVPHLLASRRARRIAESTRGVRAVIDRVDVRAAARDDEAIRAEVAEALAVDAALTGREIDVDVRSGRVRLEGVVRSIVEQQLAGDLAESVRGVARVENALAIEPPEARPDEEIRAEVSAALERDVRIDPGAIEVHVEDGAVTLRGAVGSAAEREVARTLAAASGARSVDEELEVRWWARGEMRRAQDVAAWSDERVEAAVRDAIVRDPRIRIENVSIDVAAGIATLGGIVPSAAAKAAALDTALATVGVWRVHDRLHTRPEPAIDDATLEARVTARLAANPWTTTAPIEVDVRDGRVTLTGDVRSRTHIREAVHAATRVAGVREVDARLELDAGWEPLEDWELTAEIRDGLVWNPFLDRMNVQVTVEDGVATLRGEVDDVRAFREAEREAYEAGAVHVVNELAVRGLPRRGTPAPPAPRR